jgi:hypothetical protein
MRIIVLVLQSWYNPERVQFGALRVLNDDTIAAGMGFGTHPHDNIKLSPFRLKETWLTKTAWEIQKSYEMGCTSHERRPVKHSEFNQTMIKELNCCRFGFSNQQNIEPIPTNFFESRRKKK